MQMLFDACTVINMIHIDEDEFLLRQLQALEFQVCQTVFDEISINVYNKFKHIRPYPEKLKKEIDIKLNNIRPCIYHDRTYLDLCDDVKSATGYSKTNGEFHSTVLAAYINTFEQIFVHFYTDDRPALKEFSPFLNQNQIGIINDSVDLLVLLYRHNPAFNKNDLIKYLSRLFSEYVSVIAEIEKGIISYEIPKSMIRNQDLRKKRDELLETIRERDVQGLQRLYFSLHDDKSTYDSLLKQLTIHEEFFQQNITRDYLEKIKKWIKLTEEDTFFKWAC